ncbi:MAG TPA: ABC transporter permease, partial [Gemmatimonadales bacterium]|nr:ABC transporter permease [Gemmatimonadales bacterium]
RRVVQGLLILWIVTSATFALMHLAPGGPSMLADPKLGPVERAAIEARLGLDRPLPAQYLAWHRDLLRGDLGQSYLYQTPAGGTVLARVPNTLLLAGSALLLSILIAVPLGIRAGLRPRGATDRVLEVMSFAALSLPTFWYGIVHIMLFAAIGHLLPAGGIATPGLEGSIVDRLRHLVLPVAVLSLPITAELFRYVRSGIATGAGAPHIPAARAKGLRERDITRRHLLRNALLPLITVFGLQAPVLVGGAAITETVFSWPGMGRLGVEAALSRDYPVVMATTLAVAAAVVAVNIVLDLMYRWIDPRVRIE